MVIHYEKGGLKRGLQRGFLMSLCRSFANPPVACLGRDKCHCRFFAVVLNLCDAVRNTSCYNPSNLFARERLAKTRHVTGYSPAKTGEYPRLLKTVSLDDAIREF